MTRTQIARAKHQLLCAGLEPRCFRTGRRLLYTLRHLGSLTINYVYTVRESKQYIGRVVFKSTRLKKKTKATTRNSPLADQKHQYIYQCTTYSPNPTNHNSTGWHSIPNQGGYGRHRTLQKVQNYYRHYWLKTMSFTNITEWIVNTG